MITLNRFCFQKFSKYVHFWFLYLLSCTVYDFCSLSDLHGSAGWKRKVSSWCSKVQTCNFHRIHHFSQRRWYVKREQCIYWKAKVCFDILLVWYIIANYFCHCKHSYFCPLVLPCNRSNFLATKFSVYDALPLPTGAKMTRSRSTRLIGSRQVLPCVPSGSYPVAHISFELNVSGSR